MGMPAGASALAVTTNATFCNFQICNPSGATASRTGTIDTACYSIICGASIANGAAVTIQRMGWDGIFRNALVIAITSNTPYFGSLVQLCPAFGFQFVTSGLSAGTITYMDFVCSTRGSSF